VDLAGPSVAGTGRGWPVGGPDWPGLARRWVARTGQGAAPGATSRGPFHGPRAAGRGPRG